jgi:hypothetical protein
VEGALLTHGFESFVGLFPIPMRHGMTIAELARLFNEEFGLGAQLEVIRLEGWERSMFFDDMDLPWVMPSPNMPTLETAVVYPGTVLFEGTMLSEGRGTTRRSSWSGAPWIEAERFAREHERARACRRLLPAAVFEPTFQKHAKQTVRRLPDPRDRSPACSSRCSTASRSARRSWRRNPSSSPGVSRRTNTSTTRCRSTSWPARMRCERRSKPSSRRRDRGELAADEASVQDSARTRTCYS